MGSPSCFTADKKASPRWEKSSSSSRGSGVIDLGQGQGWLFLGWAMFTIPDIEVSSSSWGLPPLSLDGLFHGKSESKMDDDWRYAYDSGNLRVTRILCMVKHPAPVENGGLSEDWYAFIPPSWCRILQASTVASRIPDVNMARTGWMACGNPDDDNDMIIFGSWFLL